MMKKVMERKIPKMCLTCQHYAPFYCKSKQRHIGYIECDQPTKCKRYRLSDDYKKGGKWYEGDDAK